MTEEPRGEQTVQPAWIAWKGADRLLAGETACSQSSDLDKVPITTSFILDRTREGSIRPIYLEKVQGPQLPIQFRDRLLSFLPGDPDHVLIEARNEDELYPDVLRIDMRTGQSATVVRRRIGFTDWMADAQGAVRLGIAYPGRDLHRVIYVRASAHGDWQPIHQDVLGTDPAFVPLAFSAQQAEILYVGVEELGHLAIRKFDTNSLTLGKIIAAEDGKDAVPVMRAGSLIGYRLGDGPVVYLDEAWRKTAEAVRSALPGATIELVDRSDDGKRALVQVTDTSLPPSYYLFDKRTDGTHLDEIGISRDRRIVGHTAPTQSVNYLAQDGSSIPAYVTLPPGVQKGPVPFVVLLHDDPAGRDKAGFDYLVQFLANKGYGVFQPQFRGSAAPSASLGTGIRGAGLQAKAASQSRDTNTPGGGLNGVAAQGMQDRGRGLASLSGTSRQAYEAYAQAFGKTATASSYYEQALFRPGPREDSIIDRDYAGLSGGVGTGYSRAGYGEWGRSVQDDIVDGTHWLIAQGYADPDRVCIAGTGFGGYSALIGAARDPYLYRCAATLAPMTDLPRIATDAREFLNGNYVRGYLATNSDSLSDISPVSLADRIDVPVLLVHGRQDCEVPVVQSEEMERALQRTREKIGSVEIASLRPKEAVTPSPRKAARPPRSVTALYLDGADHRLSRESDRIAYLAALEAFLGANLN
jgi:dipeptidyl aminopeptidase/acylaminoacyl peptidase